MKHINSHKKVTRKKARFAFMAVNIFFCYAHKDEPYLNKLKAYLRPLQRQGLMDVRHDRDISAGTDWQREISQRLNEARIVLLLVSPDFTNSDYCYSVDGSAPSDLVDSVLSFFSINKNVSTAHPIDAKSLEQKGEPAHGIR